MEFLAKIIREKRPENKQFWQYDFLNLQTGEEDSFYHREKVDHFPSLPGKLELDEDDQEQKFYQDFDQQIFKTAEELQKVEELEKSIWLKKGLEKDIREIDNDFSRRKFKLTPQQITRLRQLGITQKQIAITFGVSERTVRNREKEEINKPKKTRGRKRKITGYDLVRLRSFTKSKEDKSIKTQQEIVEEYRKLGLKLNQSTVSRTLTKENQTYKRANKRYSELDIKKARQFIKDKYWLYSYQYCFSLDEFGFYSNEVPSSAPSRKGCSVEIVQPGEKGIRYTVILCVQNLAGQSKIKVKCKLIKNIREKKIAKKRTTKAVDLHDFIKGINFPKGSRILLDNAKIHHAIWTLIKAKRLPIKELAVKKGIILEYLPPRAPMIQPAELFINNIKDYIKRERPRTDKKVRSVIKEAMENLRQRDLTETFLHCRDKLNVKLDYKSGK